MSAESAVLCRHPVQPWTKRSTKNGLRFGTDAPFRGHPGEVRLHARAKTRGIMDILIEARVARFLNQTSVSEGDGQTMLTNGVTTGVTLSALRGSGITAADERPEGRDRQRQPGDSGAARDGARRRATTTSCSWNPTSTRTPKSSACSRISSSCACASTTWTASRCCRC